MLEPVTLNIVDVLKNARAAFDAGELQAQQPKIPFHHRPCKYSGPCAIGVALSAEDRELLDSQASSDIVSLIENRLVSTDDDQALKALQSAHDNWATHYDGRPASFLATLQGLEEKYGLAA